MFFSSSLKYPSPVVPRDVVWLVLPIKDEKLHQNSIVRVEEPSVSVADALVTANDGSSASNVKHESYVIFENQTKVTEVLQASQQKFWCFVRWSV